VTSASSFVSSGVTATARASGDAKLAEEDEKESNAGMGTPEKEKPADREKGGQNPT
jgi:hypothetical protein